MAKAVTASISKLKSFFVCDRNHRVTNVFALVNSMRHMSARSSRTPEEFSDAVRGRFRALGRAHELVQPGLSLTEAGNSRDVPLGQVLEDAAAKDIPPPANALGRFGSEEDDIAPVVLFITGYSLTPDGGSIIDSAR